MPELLGVDFSLFRGRVRRSAVRGILVQRVWDRPVPVLQIVHFVRVHVPRRTLLLDSSVRDGKIKYHRKIVANA
jgi:hypothetical protein